MRVALTLSALSAGLVLAGAGAAVAGPLPQAKNAAEINAGLEAMREFNLIALKDLKSSSSVQGRTFVGGNLSGSSSNYLTGAGQSGGVALTVAGDVTGSAKNVKGGGAVKVGGNLDSGANLNGGGNAYVDGNAKKINAGTGSVYVDGNVEQTNAQHIYYGGTIKTSNGVKHAGDHSQAGLQDSLEAIAADYAAELTATSEYFADLSATHFVSTPNAQDVVFNAGAGSGVAVFAISDLETLLKGRSNLKFSAPAFYDAVIVNVAGSKITLPGSINFNAASGLGSKVIWNFYEATSVNFGSKNWYGSVLAPNAELKFNNFIEGSVVARDLVQNGEVRLGNFSGGGLSVARFADEVQTAVPEPATWAMMIMGFGAIGAVIRRRRALVAG